MIPLTLRDLAGVVGGRLHCADGAEVVRSDVVIDSRRVVPGGLFCAVLGERVDGHSFAAGAMSAGAAGVLGTRQVPGVPMVLVDDVAMALGLLARHVVNALGGLRIAGITGSSGKTSTKDVAAQLIERLGPTIAPAGSFNNEYGLPLTVLRADESTRYLVLEFSARGIGHIAYLCGIAPPRYGAVLNVGHAHAGEFGSLEAVAKAKGELVEALPSSGAAILNADDPRVLAMASRTQARVVTFGIAHPDADIRAAQVRLDEMGRARFTLLTPEGSAPVALRLHGAHHVPNSLAAAALARELGLGHGEIADGLSDAVARSRWRMEVTTREDGVVIINDAYNANPESVRAALDALQHIARRSAHENGGGRSFAILGHMAELGATSRAAHEQIGEYAAASGVTCLIAVGEESELVVAGARHAGMTAAAVPDGASALARLRDELKPGDVVLVKASRAASLEAVAAALESTPAGLGPEADQ